MSGSRSLLASGRLNPGLKVRLGLWILSSVILSAIFFREFWAGLSGMLSPVRILEQHQASPWGVLTLCVIFLWLKRKQVGNGMQTAPALVFILAGLALTVGALLVTVSADYRVFQVLLVWLGVFTIFFGKGVKVPFILLTIYGFAISFPLVVRRFAEDVSAHMFMVPLVWILNVLGYTFTTEGQWINLISSRGDSISVVITGDCAGTASMGVFLAIFTLMMLDMPLPPKKAAWLLFLGVAGTWFQNLIRMVILMMTGYYLGEKAMWIGHSWIGYIMFPLWYLFFVYIYFRQFGRQKRVEPAVAASYRSEG